MIGEMEGVLDKGERFCNLLYTMRSLSPALHVKSKKKLRRTKCLGNFRPRTYNFWSCVITVRRSRTFPQRFSVLVRRQNETLDTEFCTTD